MYNKIKVQDTAEAFFIDADGVAKFFGCTSSAGINKAVSADDIRCGIGAGIATRIFTANDLTVTVETGLYANAFIEMQSGEKFDDTQTPIVWKAETVKAETTTAPAAKLTITGTPVDGEFYVQDRFGMSIDGGTIAAKVITIGTGLTDGEMYTVVYPEAQTGAYTLEFKTASFPKVTGIMLHTIAYDPDTDEVLADIYWDIPKASPDGNLDLAYAIQTNTATSATFRALDANGKTATYIVVPRA